MNLNEYSMQLEREVNRVNARLEQILNTIAGPIPEKTGPQAPCSVGLIGTFQSVGQALGRTQEQLDRLESFLLNPMQGKAAQVAGISNAQPFRN